MKRGTLLFLLFSAVSAGAGTRGVSSADFLRLSATARGTALGDAVVSFPDGPGALAENPAGLTHAPPFSVLLGCAPHAAGSARQFASFAHNPSPAAGAWGLGFRSLSYGEISMTDEIGEPLGRTSPSDSIVSLGYARMFPGLDGMSAGAAAEMITVETTGRSRAPAASAGVLSRGYRGGRLSFSAVLRHAGGRLRGEGPEGSLPQTFRAGASFRFSPGWRAALEADAPRGGGVSPLLGAEYRRSLSGGNAVFFRTGYDGRNAPGAGESSAFSAGMGVVIRGFVLDYGFRFREDGWATHHVDAGFRFGPAGGESLAPDVRSFLEEGRRLLAQGQIPEAVVALHGALSRDPSNPAVQAALREAAGLLP